MTYLRLGRSCGTRYPRWGYLDRQSCSPYLWKAIVATCVIHLAAAGVLQRYGSPASLEAPRQIEFESWRSHSLPPLELFGAKPAALPRIRAIGPPIPVPDYRPALEEFAESELGLPAASNPGESEGAVATPGFEVTLPEAISIPAFDDYVAVEKAPELVRMDEPVYREIAREAGVEGMVILRVLVNLEGFVERAVVVRGLPMLNESALEAAYGAAFKPAQQNGRPVMVWVTIPIEFTLH